MTRAERVEQVHALKREGLNGIQIAERLGISRSFAYELLDDPTGEKVRKRKAKQGGVCVDCGKPTSYKLGGAAERCVSCRGEAQQLWTAEAIVAAMHRFNERYGQPPTATHWSPALAIKKGRPEYAKRFYADGDYPYTSTVMDRFSTWNAGLVAAGFPPRTKGAGSRRYIGDDPAVRPEAVRLYVSGLSAQLVAERLGCSAHSVERWTAIEGVLRTPSEAQRLRWERRKAVAA